MIYHIKFVHKTTTLCGLKKKKKESPKKDFTLCGKCFLEYQKVYNLPKIL